jgi:hypothetical protein
VGSIFLIIKNQTYFTAIFKALPALKAGVFVAGI